MRGAQLTPWPWDCASLVSACLASRPFSGHVTAAQKRRTVRESHSPSTPWGHNDVLAPSRALCEEREVPSVPVWRAFSVSAPEGEAGPGSLSCPSVVSPCELLGHWRSCSSGRAGS